MDRTKTAKEILQPATILQESERGKTHKTGRDSGAVRKTLGRKLMGTSRHENRQNKQATSNLNYNTSEITIKEIREVLDKMKQNNTTGPDRVPMEVFKEMDNQGLEWTQKVLNMWWLNEQIEVEQLRANICLIYKKGDIANLNNHIPIALLNSLYKIFAAVLKRIIADTLDHTLQNTQFGFRKEKGTADAIHCIRRALEQGEQTTTKTLLVLLDWETTFDKVDREALYIAMRKMNIPEQLVNFSNSGIRRHTI